MPAISSLLLLAARGYVDVSRRFAVLTNAPGRVLLQFQPRVGYAHAVDIASHGSRSDLQALGQSGAGLVASRLHERGESQQPCRGFPHGLKSAIALGPNLT